MFFVIVYGCTVMPHKAQNWMLLPASYLFYAGWDWRFLVLLAGSTVIDFDAAKYIHRRQTRPGAGSRC